MASPTDQGARSGGRKLATYLGLAAVALGVITLVLGVVRGGNLIGPGLVAMAIGLVTIASARKGDN